MKRLHFGICTFAATAAFLTASCVDDDIIKMPDEPDFISSETIIFTNAPQWEPDQVRSGGSAERNRVGNFYLSSEGADSLPVGVYVQEGIHPAAASAPQTRGAVLTQDALNQFQVWGALTKDASIDGGKEIAYIDNVTYSKATDAGTDYFKSADGQKYYWPGAGTLDFVAVGNAPTEGVTYTKNAEETSLASMTYTVPTDPIKQNDIVVATASDISGNTNGSVPLSFKHILSAVNVKVGHVVEGEILSITFAGINKKGTYNVASGKWSVDNTPTGNYSVVFEGNSDSFTVPAGTSSGTPVNDADATFMMIPQDVPTGAEMIVEFRDGENEFTIANGNALRGSLEGDIWEMNKTTNYMLSIDESFTLQIEPQGKKLDAHYIIAEANITVTGITDWTLTAEADDGANVTVIRKSDANPLAQQGFWTDVEVDANGNETTTSARGAATYTGSGDMTAECFYVFIPENVTNKDRNITLTLKSANSNVSSSKVLVQKFPNWTGDIGWEVVDDDEAGKYGFKWTRKVAYIYPYSRLFASTATNHCQDFIDTYGAGENNFATVSSIRLGIGQNRAYILLDYSVLNNVTGAESSTDGYNNTLALYNAAGTTSTSQFETIVTSTMKTESGKETENMFRLPTEDEISAGCPVESGSNNDLSAILEYVQKKNRYCLQKGSVSGDASGNTYIPYFQVKDLKWYLPAHGQFTGVDFTPDITDDSAADYWSSTTGTTSTTAYIGSGVETDRDEQFQVIAVRMNEGGYTNSAVVTVNTESMSGGENGEAVKLNKRRRR